MTTTYVCAGNTATPPEVTSVMAQHTSYHRLLKYFRTWLRQKRKVGVESIELLIDFVSILVSNVLCEWLPACSDHRYIRYKRLAVATKIRPQRRHNCAVTLGHGVRIFVHYEHNGNFCNESNAENVSFRCSFAIHNLPTLLTPLLHPQSRHRKG